MGALKPGEEVERVPARPTPRSALEAAPKKDPFEGTEEVLTITQEGEPLLKRHDVWGYTPPSSGRPASMRNLRWVGGSVTVTVTVADRLSLIGASVALEANGCKPLCSSTACTLQPTCPKSLADSCCRCMHINILALTCCCTPTNRLSGLTTSHGRRGGELSEEGGWCDKQRRRGRRRGRCNFDVVGSRHPGMRHWG